MTVVVIDRQDAFASWRTAARLQLARSVKPTSIQWTVAGDQPFLFGAAEPGEGDAPKPSQITVPKPFLSLAQSVCCHADDRCFALLYKVLWRLQTEVELLDNEADVDVHALLMMQKSVHRDAHKMKAFVRFREVSAGESASRRSFIAWFEPEHFIVHATAPFFARRFADMDWAIVTPKGSALFRNARLDFGPGEQQPSLPTDASEELWKAYFNNIFNPARLKVKSMQSHMPKKYWHNMPEAQLIPGLIAGAAERARHMQQLQPSQPSAQALKIKAREHVTPIESGQPAETLQQLNRDIRACTRCPLHCQATQAVCGDGPSEASIMLVGEQPGDQEDLVGRPFVGPAGELLMQALQAQGLDRSSLYLSNAVKHFKFKPRGKRRIHERASPAEISHCRWWLDQELALVKPKLVVCLGSTAALSVTGSGAEILKRRGKLEASRSGIPALLTVHPSAILRVPDKLAAAELRGHLEVDLALARTMVAQD